MTNKPKKKIARLADDTILKAHNIGQIKANLRDHFRN